MLRSSKGFQYLHTRGFVTALRWRSIHFSEVEANAFIAREQSNFIDKTGEHSQNRLWMLAHMGRVLYWGLHRQQLKRKKIPSQMLEGLYNQE
ncbi:hypothetical protein ACXDJA_003737 [Klebsiella variicola]